MKITKYNLAITDEQHIPMPEGAIIVDIQLQHADDVVMFAIQDDKQPLFTRTFIIVEEDVDMKPGMELVYVGSVQTHLVKNTHHFFEVRSVACPT